MNKIIRLACVFPLCLLSLLISGCAAMQREADLRAQNSQMAVSTMKGNLGKVYIGTSEKHILVLLGTPTENNVSQTAAGKSEQWIYTGATLMKNEGYDIENMNLDSYSQYENVKVYLYFDNGILTSTQGF